MSDQGIERIDDELATLLRAERDARPSREALERVWSRLARSLPLGGGSGGGQSGGGGVGGPLAGHLGLKGVATLLVVALGGAVIVAATRRSPPSQSTIEPAFVTVRQQAPSGTTSSPPTSVPTEVPSVPAPASVDSQRVATRKRTSKPVQLDRERAVLDEARAALRDGDGAAALAAADRHARVFAHPELAEEREALAIRALVILGRYDDARARAARFRTMSPNSLFMPSVDSSLASIP